MSNVLKFVKKLFTLGVVSTTMLWSVGASLLVAGTASAAACPVLNPGDMIKVVGKPAIYAVNNDGKVLYFPSGDEFKSWRPTYGGYISINQDCYDSLSVPSTYPGAVNYHPGSYVVKRPSSSQLYVVEQGNTLAKITPEAAKALYGTGYKVMTVLDQFWPHYVNRGTDVTEGKPHPGMLVKNGGKTWWVNTDGTLSEVTDAGFTANGFQTRFVHVATDAMISGMSFGSVVSAEVKSVTDKTQSGGVVMGPPVTPGVAAGNLTVALAADNPAGGYLATQTAFNRVLKFTLTAGSGTVNVTGFKFRKGGYLANSQISGVDVVDSKGMRHGNVITTLTADNDAMVTMTSDPIMVTAGTPETVTVRVNLTGTTSGVIQFSLVAAASVTSNGTVGGSFPVVGNQFSVQDGSTSVATVTLDTQPVYASGQTLNADADNEQDITKFQIQNTSNNEAVQVFKLRLYNNGTAADTDFKDVQLIAQDGTTVLATAQPSSKYITFDLTASPFPLDKGINKIFTVRAKLVNGAARTIQLTVYNDFDLEVKGTTTGAYVLATAATNATGNASASSFPVGNGSVATPGIFNRVTIGSGTLSFNKDASSPTASVTPGSNGIVLAKFFAKPNGENMELRKITLAITTTTAIGLNGTVYVKVDGAVVYSIAASSLSVSSGSPTNVTLSSYPVLTAGHSSYVTVEASIKSTATGSDSYKVYLDLTEVKRQITNDIQDPSVNQASGNSIAVNAAALTVTNLATPVSANVVAGTNSFPCAKLELNAGTSGEDIKVTQLVVTSSFSGTTASDLGNLVFYDETGSPLTTTNSTATFVSSTTGVTFTFTTPILVTRTTPRVLTLDLDVLARSSAATFRCTVLGASSVTATGKDTGNTVTATFGTGSGQTMTVQTGGTLSASIVSGSGASPSLATVVNIGTQNNSVFAFKLTAQNEALKMTTIKISASSSLGMQNNDVVNLRLYRDTDTQPFAQGNQMTCSANVCYFVWTATDNILPSTIQPGSPATIYVKADIGAPGAAVLGDSYQFYISATSTDLIAKGAFTGTTASTVGTPQSSAATFITPFRVAVDASSPLIGTTAASTVVGNGTALAIFKVTNYGQAQITLDKFKVTNSGTYTSTSTTLKLQYSDQNSQTANTNTASTTVAGTNYSNTTITFSTSTGMATGITIDGGSYRYVQVAIGLIGGSVTGDTYQFSVAALGDVTFNATELNLGYEGDANVNSLADTIYALYSDGKPQLGVVTKQ